MLEQAAGTPPLAQRTGRRMQLTVTLVMGESEHPDCRKLNGGPCRRAMAIPSDGVGTSPHGCGGRQSLQTISGRDGIDAPCGSMRAPAFPPGEIHASIVDRLIESDQFDTWSRLPTVCMHGTVDRMHHARKAKSAVACWAHSMRMLRYDFTEQGREDVHASEPFGGERADALERYGACLSGNRDWYRRIPCSSRSRRLRYFQ